MNASFLRDSDSSALRMRVIVGADAAAATVPADDEIAPTRRNSHTQ
jgi:hypothetical protein